MTHAVNDDGRTPTPDVPRTSAQLRGASFNEVRRHLATQLKGSPPAVSAMPLELVSRGAQDAPTLRDVELLEPGGLRATTMDGASPPRFSGFLDGAQWSLVLWASGVPVVHGTVAAVIRERVSRRMITWRSPVVRRALYAPLALLPRDWRDAIAQSGLDVVDTLEKRRLESGHPFELQEIAYQSVLSAREAIERELAETWCESGGGARDLFVDGGIAGSKQVARSPNVVGVVKSHQRLYVSSDHLATIMGLSAGQRTSVVKVAEARRAAVASWYLRLRDPAGHDPFWGLVRVEVALPAKADTQALTQHADEVSRWILAETLPLSVPDARWDKMAYGIRDCEEFLRAIQ